MLKKFICIIMLSAGSAVAGEAVVEGAEASKSGDSWNFSVTVSHADEGWDHYADGWRVDSPDGAELGYRKLVHPHVNEQPFTRSLGGVSVPDDMKEVTIRANDNVHGWGAPFALTLP